MAVEPEDLIDAPPRKPWTRLKRDLGVVLWSSFLASGAGSMFFFAYFDPLLLVHDDSPPGWLATREVAYAVGFFFFWVIAAAAGALVAYLLDTDHERCASPPAPERKP
jgi:hypothetical protein